jgi:hypothetical protein
MKILTFKRFIGLTAIGAVAYIHKQRGGVWTVASIKDTLQHLWSSAVSKFDLTQQREKTTQSPTGSTGAGARENSLGNQGPRTYSPKNNPSHS